MIIQNLQDFVGLINYIADNSNSPKSEKQTITTEGLSKFKEPLYEVLQYIDNSLEPHKLTPQKKDLYNALNKLTSDERNSLSKAMLTSYYTPNYIVDAISKSIFKYWEDKNLETLKICEPSAGSGKFIKPFLSPSNSIDAVEIDTLSAKILKNNFSYPNIKIHNTGYENYKPEKLLDLIAGNVPFGNYSIYDQSLSAEKKQLVNGRIHNYFFIKGSDELKPGGIMALLTTSSMNNDKDSVDLRMALMKDLNLISCVRFSDDTFKDSKTKVVSDLLILQKPLSPKETLTQRELDFIETVNFDEEMGRLPVNLFLKNNPENILGELYITQGFLGKEILSVQDYSNIDRSERLIKILDNDFDRYAAKKLLDMELSNDLVKPSIDNAKIKNDQIIKAYPYAVPGNIIFFENTFQKVTHGHGSIHLLETVPFNVHARDHQKLSVIIELRDTYKALRAELRENNIPKALILQNALNEQYDLFVFLGDNINTIANSKLLAPEADFDLLKGLEIFSNDSWIKSEIFTRDFNAIQIDTPKVQTIEDSIALSFQKHGRLDKDYITSVYGKELNFWIKEALEKELLFINPVIKDFDKITGFELSIPSKFISGYVEGKLSIYQNSALLVKDNPYGSLIDKSIIDKSKETLINALPFKLNIAEINPGMGEPWVDNSIYEMFARDHFDLPEFSIHHIPGMDKFKISGGYSSFANANYTVDTNYNRVGYLKIFEYAMIHNIPDFKKKVYRDGQEMKIADKDTINAVLLAVDKLNSAFTNWLMQQKEISQALENRYHRLNNAVVKENYNISLLNFDDISAFTPYNHQKNAVWQIVNQKGGIVDHEVGFGKTYTMAMATMKKKQFGLINKELVVGLNANYAALYESYKQIYPNGKFLLVQPDDLVPAKKQETFYKIANNDWDAVITAHSCLMKFPIAPYAQKEILEESINEIKSTVRDSDFSKILSRGEMNRLNKRLEDAEAKYQYSQDIINERKEKGTLIFDDLGFDSLTIDESQEFKNLAFTTKHTRVAGLGSQGEVQKTTNLLSYIRHIQGIHKADEGITFASGTTISNSITEMYTTLKYQKPSLLKEKGINTFDQWARVYARKTTEYEESVTGMIKQKERFRHFVKVPELAKMYNDITNYADFNTFKIERPSIQTKLVTVEPYKEQLEYFERIKLFGASKDPSHLIGAGSPNKSREEIQKAVGLICTSLGRKAALSLKLIDPSFPDHPNDKIHTMVNNAVDIYKKFDSVKGTQLVFLDQGVPGSVNYNLYAYVKSILIQKGIPEKEIAFIHDWDKKRDVLFKKVNSGEIRFMFGSTSKMGIGVNVQQRIVAMHHLDQPWRPTDLVQRNGRGGRPGNIVLPQFNNEMDVFFYATKQSLDSYQFNLLQIKHNFILQIKNASLNTREIDEGMIDANGGMDFAQYMAACSSNQYLTERLQVEKKLNGLIDFMSSVELTYRQKTNQLGFIKSDIAKNERIIEKLNNDLSLMKDVRTNVLNGSLYNNDKEIAAILRNKLAKQFATKDFSSPFVSFANGFNLIVGRKHNDVPIDKDNYSIFLQTPSLFKIGWKSNVFTKDDKEVSKYADNCLSRIEILLQSEKQRLSDNEKNFKEIQNVLEKKEDKTEEINKLKKELVRLDVLIERENKKDNPDSDVEIIKQKGSVKKI